MNQQNSPPSNPIAGRLLSNAWAKIAQCCPDHANRWIIVDVQSQQLALLREKVVLQRWPVSTAEAGINNRTGSGGTPAGLHRILQGIGKFAPFGAIFESRQPTGGIWNPADTRDSGSDLILTRILTLDGQEEGINRGPGIDSLERYIYIHGTNQEALIGQPVSHGCVRMTNADIINLYDHIEEGDPVVIL